MKFTQFTPEVNLNITQAKVQAVDNPAAYGANQSGNQAIMQGLEKVKAVIHEQWQKGENDRVIKAVHDLNDEVNKKLWDEKDGIIYTMQGADAAGLQAAYEKIYREARDKVMQNRGIRSNYATQAFNQQADTFNSSNLSLIDKYQRKGMEDDAKSQQDGAYNDMINATAKDPKNAAKFIETYISSVKAIQAGLHTPDAQTNVFIKNQLNNSAQDSLTTALQAGDYDGGLQAIKEYRRYGVNENILKRMENALKSKQITKETQKGTKEYIANNPQLLKGTKEDAYIAFRKDNPIQFKRKGIATGNPEYDKYDNVYSAVQKELGWDDETTRLFKSAGFQESSFNPNAVSSDGADGRGIYQFDADTARENGLDPADRFDPEKNIRAAAYMFERRRKKYGGDNEMALLAHNGGEGGIEYARKAGYHTLVYEKEKYLYGDEPTQDQIDKYMEDDRNAFYAEFEIEKREMRERTNALLDDIRTNIFRMENNNASGSEKLVYLKEQLNLHPELESEGQFQTLYINAKAAQTKETAAASGNFVNNGALRQGTKDEMDGIRSLIGRDINNVAQLDVWLRDEAKKGIGFSGAQYDELKREVEEAEHGTGKYSINFDDIDASQVADYMGVKQSDIKELLPYAIIAARQSLWKEGNTQPSYGAKLAAIKNALTYENMGKFYFPKWHIFGKYTRSNLAERIRLRIEGDIKPVDDGRAFVFQIRNKHGELETKYVPTEDMEDVLAGRKRLEAYSG